MMCPLAHYQLKEWLVLCHNLEIRSFSSASKVFTAAQNTKNTSLLEEVNAGLLHFKLNI